MDSKSTQQKNKILIIIIFESNAKQFEAKKKYLHQQRQTIQMCSAV